jgi:hypothetical protein
MLSHPSMHRLALECCGYSPRVLLLAELPFSRSTRQAETIPECLGMSWLHSGSLPGRRRFRDVHPECIKGERHEPLFFSWSPPSLTLIRCWSLVFPSHHSVFYDFYDLNSRDGSQILLICCHRRYVRFSCVSVFLLVRPSRSYSRFWLDPN